MQEKFSCAIDELERLWTVDSTRADSSFFSKITYAANGGNDTTRFVKWALKGVERYPDHQDILNAANRAYGMTGDADNAIASARKLMVINPYDPAPVKYLVFCFTWGAFVATFVSYLLNTGMLRVFSGFMSEVGAAGAAAVVVAPLVEESM
jgi:hypothetical protein